MHSIVMATGKEMQLKQRLFDMAKAFTPQDHFMFWGLLLFLALVYMPVYQNYYANSHDYNLLTRGFLNYDAWVLIKVGRPVSALILSIASSLISTFADISFARFLIILLFGVSAYLFYRWLRSNSVSLIHALLLVVAIFTLPSFQVYIAMMSTGIKISFCLLITIYASQMAFKGADQITTPKTVFNKYVKASAALLLVSLMIYPSASMFYWVMLSVPLMGVGFDSLIKNKKKLVTLFSLPLITSGIYFIFGFFMLHGIQISESHKFVVSTEPMGKLTWFFLGSPIIKALNLWYVPSTDIAAYIILFVILLGILAGAVKAINDNGKSTQKNKSKIIIRLFQQYFLIACLIPLSCLPILAAAGGHATYRTLIAISSLIVIILYWSIANFGSVLPYSRKSHLVTSILVVASLYGVFTAHRNVVDYFIIPATSEIRFIRSALLQSDLTKIDRIHVIRPEVKSLTGKRMHHSDEFGALWSSGGAATMIKAILNELDFIPEHKNFKLTNSTGESNYYSPNPNSLLIDMRRLHHFFDTEHEVDFQVARSESIDPQGKVGRVSSHPISDMGGGLAFVRNLKSQFWETVGDHPHWIQIDFSEMPKTIVEYGVKISDIAGSVKRAPKEWQLQASNDGKEWSILDTASKQTDWKENEKRVFKIFNESAFRYYRLYVTAGNTNRITRVHELHLIRQCDVNPLNDYNKESCF